MAISDEHVSALTVVFKDQPDAEIPAAVEKLKGMGMRVDHADLTLGVVDGCISTSAVEAIRQLGFVQYVRVEMTYLADYPPGHPRDRPPADAEPGGKSP